MEKLTSRRTILLTSLKGGIALITASLLGPTLLSSCKKNSGTNNRGPIDEKSLDVKPCPNQENLSDQEKAIRASLKYVDNSPYQSSPRKTCDNCRLYTFTKNNTDCKGCQVVPGPIHPKGYCTAWLPRM